tara:strand:+ start:6819 stop:7400 length:582 start_codon:yes stop_codon:yes gene_type:complete
MKFLPLILSLIACQPGKIDVTNEAGSNISKEDLSPITWTDCSSNEGDHPCDFTLKDHLGNDVNLYELYGKPIVVDFSTMWCYYCQMAGYDVKEIADLYSDEELIYITVLIENFGGSKPEQTDLAEWADHFGLGDVSTPVLSGEEQMMVASKEDGWYAEAWPTFYFIDDEMRTKMYLRGWSAASINAGVESIIQ